MFTVVRGHFKKLSRKPVEGGRREGERSSWV